MESDLAEFLVFMRQCVENEHVLGIVDSFVWTHLYANPAAKNCLAVIASKMPLEQRAAFLLKYVSATSSYKTMGKAHSEKKAPHYCCFTSSTRINPGKVMGTLIKEAERLAIFNDLNDSSEVMRLLKTTHAWPKEGV